MVIASQANEGYLWMAMYIYQGTDTDTFEGMIQWCIESEETHYMYDRVLGT